MLVLTGVTDPAHAVLAPPDQRPAYLAQDLNGLLEPHPEVEEHDGDFSCRGWTARWDADKLQLSGDGDRIDALRALCVAAWSRDSLISANTAADAVDEALKRVG
jgi:glycerol-1-phosphatase